MTGLLVLLAVAMTGLLARAARARRRQRAADARQAASAVACNRYRRELLHFAGQLRWDEPDDAQLRTTHLWLRDRCSDNDLDQRHLSAMDAICSELVSASTHRLEPKYADLAANAVSAQIACASLSPEQPLSKANKPLRQCHKRSERGNYDEP